MKSILCKCVLQEEKTVDIGTMQAEIQSSTGVLVDPLEGEVEPLEGETPIEEPKPLEPISIQDLDALFAKDADGNPIEGCGWCITDHDADGNPIFWMSTVDDNMDVIANDSRLEVLAQSPEPVSDEFLIDELDAIGASERVIR